MPFIPHTLDDVRVMLDAIDVPALETLCYQAFKKRRCGLGPRRENQGIARKRSG